MRVFTILQEIVAILMVFLVLLLPPGCATYKNIATSDLTNSGKYYYEIYAGNTKYKLENAVIHDQIFEGKIVQMAAMPQKIKIYLTADSVVKIGNNKILTFPMDQIVKVQREETSIGLTVLSIIGVITLIVIIFEAISFSTSGIDLSI